MHFQHAIHTRWILNVKHAIHTKMYNYYLNQLEPGMGI